MATSRRVRLWCVKKLRRLARALDYPMPDRSGTGIGMEEVFRRLERAMVRERFFLDPNLTLYSFSREAGFNRTYVSRSLACHNLRFKAYVGGYRLQYAIDLMRQDAERTLTMEEIAVMSGFQSERSLSNYMKRSYGVPAGTFRQRMGAGDQAKNRSTSFKASGSAKTATRS